MKNAFVLLIMLIVLVDVFGEIINVPADYTTIQAAINYATELDTILVQPGTYHENCIDFAGKSLTLASLYLTTQDRTYIEQTTLEGSVLTYIELDSQAVLLGFSVVQGSIHNESSNLKISNCDFQNCGELATVILCFNQSELLLESSEIHHVCSGSSIATSNSRVIILNSIFYDNGGMFGSGDLSFLGSEIDIINSVFHENGYGEGWYGGVINLDYSTMRMVNSIMYGNDLGTYDYNIHVTHTSQLTIAYSCLEQGQNSIDLVNLELNWLDGNFSDNPLYVASEPFTEDFHLRDSSPCIGSGIDQIEIDGMTLYAPENDLMGDTRPNPTGSMPDVGAIENSFGEPQLVAEANEISENIYQLTSYPNPFNPATTRAGRSPSTTISFNIPSEQNIRLDIYNIKGQVVKTLVQERLGFGEHKVIWDGKNDQNRSIASGIYFYRLELKHFVETKKVVLLK